MPPSTTASATALTWKELHQASAEAIVGKKRWVMPLPAWYARALTHVVPGRLPPPPPSNEVEGV